MVKGLGNLQERLDKKEKERENKRSRFYLADGDIAEIRFLSSSDDFFVPEVHRIQDVSTNQKTFWRTVLCSGEDCAVCKSGDRPSERIFAWIFVEKILHKSLVDGKDWELVKNRDGKKFYVETVKAPRILESGIGRGRNLAMKFINMNSEYGTLNDRPYKWIRSGAGLDTTYELIPMDPRPFDVEKIVGDLKDLESAVVENIFSPGEKNNTKINDTSSEEDNGELF